MREPLPDAVQAGSPHPQAGSPDSRGDSREAATTRVQLLTAAAECLSERGFELTRLRDVAKRAGVSIGLLQHYFETRGALLREAFSWSCAELIERSRDRAHSLSDAPWERIVFLMDALIRDPGLKRHATAWTEFCVSAARHPELRGPVSDVYTAWRQIVVDAIEEGMALGQLAPEVPVADAADILNALVDGFEMATAVDAELIDPERFRQLVLEVATRLLHPAENLTKRPASLRRQDGGHR